MGIQLVPDEGFVPAGRKPNVSKSKTTGARQQEETA